MSEQEDLPSAPARVPTGIHGLDDILGGGLFKGGIYIVGGSPGAGKTTLANQLAFHQVARGGRAVYVTLLSESHGRMLSHLRAMSFFDANVVGRSLVYLNGFSVVESDGLDGLLKLLRRTVRDHRADLLVMDGVVTAEAFARSGVDYKKFINELQTWVAVVGCTVVFLTSAPAEATSQPEHSMVDGILELAMVRMGLRAERQLTVTKFRGSGYIEGTHTYRITSDGLTLFPRVEAHDLRTPQADIPEGRISTGVATLDTALCGGLGIGSATLLLGSSGAGKTSIGLHFLASASAAEPALHFGFFEPTAALLMKAGHLGLPLRRLEEAGHLTFRWTPPSEGSLDVIAHDLLREVRRTGAKRVFIDGLPAWRGSTHPERLGAVLTALTSELGRMGVTTMVTEETRQLYVTDVEVPTTSVSAFFHNILFVRQVDTGAQLRRLLAIWKTRDSAHDRRLLEFEISDSGLRIVGPFAPADTSVIGVGRSGPTSTVGANPPLPRKP